MRDRITLQNRAIQPPVFGTPDFTEEFSATMTVFCTINTVTGKDFFDGVTVNGIPITHEILIRFDAAVTADTWIEFDGGRLNILKVEDLDERHKVQLLTCTDRGETEQAASQA